MEIGILCDEFRNVVQVAEIGNFALNDFLDSFGDSDRNSLDGIMTELDAPIFRVVMEQNASSYRVQFDL